MASKKNDALVGTIEAKLVVLRADISAIEVVVATQLDVVHMVAYTMWVIAGGCQVCDGTGRFNHNAFSWSNGWPEWQDCKCDRTGGKAPTKETVAASEAFKLHVAKHTDFLDTCWEKLEALTLANKVVKGSVVRVVRGRKVLGSQGEVLYVGTTMYGPSANVLRADGTKFWIDPAYLSVVEISDVEKKVIEAAKLDRQQENLVKLDQVTEKFGLPDLKGSIKQIQWAMQIRAAFAEKYWDEYKQDLLKQTSAKFYIDYRNCLGQAFQM